MQYSLSLYDKHSRSNFDSNGSIWEKSYCIFGLFTCKICTVRSEQSWCDGGICKWRTKYHKKLKLYTNSSFSMIYKPNEFQANLHILWLQSSAAWKQLVFWLWDLHHWIWHKKSFPKHILLFRFGLFWKNQNFYNYHNLW